MFWNHFDDDDDDANDASHSDSDDHDKNLTCHVLNQLCFYLYYSICFSYNPFKSRAQALLFMLANCPHPMVSS